jgi:hypothetical protein
MILDPIDPMNEDADPELAIAKWVRTAWVKALTGRRPHRRIKCPPTDEAVQLKDQAVKSGDPPVALKLNVVAWRRR